MPSSAIFTGSGLTLLSVSQVSGSVIRLRYTTDPLAVSATGANDALNPANYTLSGPNANSVSSVASVGADPQAFDLVLAGAMTTGLWTLSVVNVQTATAIALSAPTALSFNAIALTAVTPLAAGGENDDAEDVLRKHIGAGVYGRGWDALIAALAVGDKIVSDNAQLAFDQKFICTASGFYLDRKCADIGVIRPGSIGISDDVFRTLAIKTSADKLTVQVMLEALEVYYGPEATRANTANTLTQPYAIDDGDELKVQVDEGSVISIFFERDDFGTPGAASAEEVAAAITRGLRRAQSTGFAVAFTDPETAQTFVRIFSGSLGLFGSIRIRGGLAQNKLQFPTLIATTQAIGTSWNIVPLSTPGRVRWTWAGGTDPELYRLRVGDYANIYGTAFDVENRGAFEIVDTSLTYFEVVDITAVTQTGVAQIAANDILFFRPTRFTIQSSGRLATAVQGDPDVLDVILPATTEIIEREETTAAYLHVATSKDILTVSRNSAGLVTVTATAHGLPVGTSWVNIDNVVPTYGGAANGVVVTGNDITEGDNPAIVKLDNGDILYCDDGGSPAYIYDSDTFTATGSMATGRTNHTATLLDNGKVLVVGGVTACELYDPTTGTWTATGSTVKTYVEHTATKMANGKVLIVGNYTVATAEIYDPVTGLWTTAAAPSTSRFGASACLLPDGRVLIAGGKDVTSTLIAYGELYNPTLDSWQLTENHVAPRHYAGSAWLGGMGTSGRFYLFGGGEPAPSSGEYYNPATNTWTAIATLPVARISPQAVLLQDGFTIAVIGGNYFGAATTSIYLYFALENRWEVGPTLAYARNTHRAILLDSGKVLVVGDVGSTQPELYSRFITTHSAGGINGLVKVTHTGANTFTYNTPEQLTITVGTGGTMTPVAGTVSIVAGPYTWDPDAGLAVTDIKATTGQVISRDNTYKILTVSSTTDFPAGGGYLVFAFGTKNSTAPVKYFDKISGTELLIDPRFVFPVDLPIGTTVTYLTQRGAFEPADAATIGSFYLTASAAGRVAASEMIDSLAAAGVQVEKEVVYPGDRGLGNEGQPASGGSKLSDKVAVWGSDDLDAEITEAREE